MAHIHTLLDGTRTGPEILSVNDSKLHWHEVAGDATSINEFGPEHIHRFRGDDTSGPIDIDENDPMSTSISEVEGSEPMQNASDHEEDKPIQTSSLNQETAMESKSFGGKTVEVKEEAVNGVPVGIIRGYIATWDLDRGLDRFVKGAFAESLNEFRAKNRPVRFKDHHGRTVGGFPIIKMFEDDKGLFGQGEINLDVQQGREAFALAKQGILTDFSIGYSVVESEIDDDIRIITKAIVWEGSIVDEPMNPAAVVTEVKSVVPFQDMPLTDRNQQWDSDVAIARVREFTGSDEEPSAAYRKAFVWFDSAEPNMFGAYKLPVSDVINGRMVVVPRAVFAAAAAVEGARGGVDIPEVDRPKVVRHLERYYAKMDLESPFKDKQFFVSDNVKTWGPRDLETFLRSSGGMSKSAAKILASRIDKKRKDEYIKDDKPEDWSSVLSQIKQIKL